MTYDNILRLSDDPDVNDVIKFHFNSLSPAFRELVVKRLVREAV